MNILLWFLQAFSAPVRIVGRHDGLHVQDAPTFGVLPREAWMALGIQEFVCTVGLIVPAAFHWPSPLQLNPSPEADIQRWS